MSDVNWRDKDDLDLTSEDISAMAAEGEPVGVSGPAAPEVVGFHIAATPGLKLEGLSLEDFDSGVLISRSGRSHA